MLKYPLFVFCPLYFFMFGGNLGELTRFGWDLVVSPKQCPMGGMMDFIGPVILTALLCALEIWKIRCDKSPCFFFWELESCCDVKCLAEVSLFQVVVVINWIKLVCFQFFTPKCGEMIQFWGRYVFSTGWFNHQVRHECEYTFPGIIPGLEIGSWWKKTWNHNGKDSNSTPTKPISSPQKCFDTNMWPCDFPTPWDVERKLAIFV